MIGNLLEKVHGVLTLIKCKFGNKYPVIVWRSDKWFDQETWLWSMLSNWDTAQIQ